MTSLLLGEAVVTAFIDKLEAGMPARVTAINEEHPEIELRPPAAYYRGRHKEFPETPAVFVMEGRGTFTDMGAHSMTFAPEILVYIAESDADSELLAVRLQRQARAVIEVLWDDEPKQAAAFGDSHRVHNIRPLRTVAGTVFEPEAVSGWRGFYTVVFRANLEEL